jgi:hypothetical protein
MEEKFDFTSALLALWGESSLTCIGQIGDRL